MEHDLGEAAAAEAAGSTSAVESPVLQTLSDAGGTSLEGAAPSADSAEEGSLTGVSVERSSEDPEGLDAAAVISDASLSADMSATTSPQLPYVGPDLPIGNIEAIGAGYPASLPVEDEYKMGMISEQVDQLSGQPRAEDVDRIPTDSNEPDLPKFDFLPPAEEAQFSSDAWKRYVECEMKRPCSGDWHQKTARDVLHMEMADVRIPRCVQWGRCEMTQWLKHLGLPQYIEALVDNNSIDGRRLCLLTASNLPRMGVHDWDHIRTISQSVRRLLSTQDPLHYDRSPWKPLPGDMSRAFYLQSARPSGRPGPNERDYGEFLLRYGFLEVMANVSNHPIIRSLPSAHGAGETISSAHAYNPVH